MIYYPTVMVRYSLFVLKVPLNPKQTNNFRYDEKYFVKMTSWCFLILQISVKQSVCASRLVC